MVIRRSEDFTEVQFNDGLFHFVKSDKSVVFSTDDVLEVKRFVKENNLNRFIRYNDEAWLRTQSRRVYHAMVKFETNSLMTDKERLLVQKCNKLFGLKSEEIRQYFYLTPLERQRKVAQEERLLDPKVIEKTLKDEKVWQYVTAQVNKYVAKSNAEINNIDDVIKEVYSKAKKWQKPRSERAMVNAIKQAISATQLRLSPEWQALQALLKTA
jgi:hypothetical protein